MDFDQLFISLYCLFVTLRYTNADECIKVDQCSCKTSKVTVDLHKLTRTLEVVGSNYTYQFQPCVGLTETCGTSTAKVAVCQRAKDGRSFDIGDLSTATFSGDPETNTLKLNYTAATDANRTSIFTFICDRNEDGKLTGVKEYPRNTYKFTFNTKYTCTEKGKKISTGSVLLIIFFLSLGIYFIAGMLFLKFVRGAQGTEMIPNYDFWTSLPGYIKDGIMFTCRGCKTESSYSQI